MLKTRIRTLLVFVPLCMIILALSHIPYVFSCAITLLSLAGVFELYRAADRLARWPQLCASCLLAIAICITGAPYYGIVLPVTFAEGAKTAWIALMVPLFFRALVEIRQLEHGLFILLLVILSCILTDVSGYFIGGAFGTRYRKTAWKNLSKLLGHANATITFSTWKCCHLLLRAAFCSCLGKC